MERLHRDPAPRAPRMAALWALLTGESLTTAQTTLTDPYMGLSPLEYEALKGFDQDFVKVGDVAMSEVRRMAQEVADGAFPPTEPPRWPGLEVLAAERDRLHRPKVDACGETEFSRRWHPDVREWRGLPRVPADQVQPAERDAFDETGRHDNGAYDYGALGRGRSQPYLRFIPPRITDTPKPTWGERFDAGVVVASLAVFAFFALRTILTSDLFQALTH